MMPYQHMQGNILVVDDTPENLAILTNMLTEHGYLVRPAINGDVALKAVQKHLPDLILLDIMMPKMSGYEVCEQLKANERTRAIPVIFISALNKIFDKVKAFSVGGVDYITKPFQIEEVLARVETHLTLRNLYIELQGKNTHLEHEVAERMRAEESLKKSLMQIERAKQEWELTADSLSYVVCLLDHQGHILRVNRMAEVWQLGQVHTLKGHDLHALFHPECQDRACYLQTFLNHAWDEVAQGLSIGCEEWDPILRRYLNVQIRPLSSASGKIDEPSLSFAIGVISDITPRKQAEISLRQHNHALGIMNQMSDALQTCHTEQETYDAFAQTCQALFPTDAGALYITTETETMMDLVAYWGATESPVAQFRRDACRSLMHNTVYAYSDLQIPPLCSHVISGPARPYLCIPIGTTDQMLGVLHIVPDPSGQAVLLNTEQTPLEWREMTITRVTKHYALALANLRLREKLRLEAIRDPLTNLYNRRYMEESLERETQRARRRGSPVGILMFDIDHFKHLNDTYGHEAGDLVLQKLGTLFRKYTRAEDVACRYGGEEFLLIMPETSLETVQHRGEELRRMIKDHLRVLWEDTLLSVTISVGVAAFPLHGATIKDVVGAADNALYLAKTNGRNQVMAATVVERGA